MQKPRPLSMKAKRKLELKTVDIRNIPYHCTTLTIAQNKLVPMPERKMTYQPNGTY